MAKSFNSWSEIEKYLKLQINEVLKEDVSEAVADELQSSVSDVVYGAGTPKVYQRRNLKDGSLGDKESMSKELIGDGLLQVTPEAERNIGFSKYPGLGYDEDKSLTENVAFGYGNKDRWFNSQRNFVEDAKENLIRNKAHIESLRDGLKDRGIDTI
jgi:hypothetical protein